MSKINHINFSPELEAIKKKYGVRYYADINAIKEAADLWGVECNAHGVALNRTEEILVQIGQCKGEMSFVETRKGFWLIGLSIQTGYSGRGYAPSVWDSSAYFSYHDARKACIYHLIDFFEKTAMDTNACNSKANRLHARHAIEILNSELTPQLALF